MLLDAALLPFRVFTSREPTASDERRELERLRREQGMPGTHEYVNYTGNSWQPYNGGRPVQRAIASSPTQRRMTAASQDYPKHHDTDLKVTNTRSVKRSR